MKPHAVGRPLILVTRPQEPGRDLAARLRGAGLDALWWPAFDLLPPADPAPLRACVARLAQFDLVVFVSPAAVRAFALALPGEWPTATAIGAVGAATASAARALLAGAGGARIHCPCGDAVADAGSEALWQALQRLSPAPQRILIVRAQGGRQWLIDRLLATGAQVEQAVAYLRLAHVPSPAQCAALRASQAARSRLAVLFSSSEAVPAVMQQLAGDPTLAGALRGAIALCVHPRIEQALRAAGYADVRGCEPEAESIRAALALGLGASAPGTASGAHAPAAPTERSRIS